MMYTCTCQINYFRVRVRVRVRGTLQLTICDNTQLGSYCCRIVAIVNSNVIIGSAWYGHWGSLLSLRQDATITTVKLRGTIRLTISDNTHTMDMLWEKFQWILPLYMKPTSFQSKALVVCSVNAAVFIDFCLKKLNVFSQHICKKKQMNIWIPQNKSSGIEMLINSLC